MPTTTVYAAVGALALVGGLTKEQQLPVIQLQPRFNHIFPRRRLAFMQQQHKKLIVAS